MNSKVNVKDLTPDERMKIAALVSKDQKSDMDWLYKQPKDDPEAFLMGKEVKSLNQVQEISKDYEETPEQRLSRFDMETKFREDPLTLMKQREAEKRVELLRNTAKVKKLRRLLTEQKLRQEKKHKHRYSGRKHRKASRSSSSSDSSDDELLDKFIKIIKQSDEMKQNASEQGASSECPSSSDASNKGLVHSNKRVANLSRQTPSSFRHGDNRPERPKLSKAEIEAKRAQMISDAKVHQVERQNRSKHHYQAKSLEEEKERVAKQQHGASFISQVKNAHVERSSIEEGVHRKASSRQRGELNTNFLTR